MKKALKNLKTQTGEPTGRDALRRLSSARTVRSADGSKLLAALAAVLAAAWAAPFLLTALFQRLFAAWGIDGETVARAPGWAQALFGGWLYVNGALQARRSRWRWS